MSAGNNFQPTPSSRPLRIASVAYFNAKPLIEGLDHDPSLVISLQVPAKLIDGLRTSETDVALLPTIDYQRLDGLRIIPAGGIGCDGPTLTVRIFSRVPIGQITSLACDTESHTSVALATILLAEQYGRRPELMPLEQGAQSAETLLLIGDKVVCEEPAGYPYQLDLGEAWKSLTGLPFVFAIWTARADVELADLASKLSAAKARGLANVTQLVERYAVPRGWPADVARRYLTEYLQFEIGPRQMEAIKVFHAMAAKHGLIANPPRELIVM